MKTVKLILINLIILATLLTLIDPWLKQSYRSTNRYVMLREPAPNVDYTIDLDSFFIKRSQGFEINDNRRLRTNDDGFYIGENYSNTDSIDIIFFGGSTTECAFVDEAKKFPYLVGEMLINNATNQKVNTLNGGLSGNNSMHSLINLIAKGIPLKPKIVVLMHNVNDLSQLVKTGSYWKSPEGRAIVVNTISGQNLKGRLYKLAKSAKDVFIPNLYQKASLYLMRQKQRDYNNFDEWKNYRQKNDFELDKLIIDYEHAIRSFVQIAKIHDIDVILMTQFNRLNPEDNFSRSYYSSDYDQLCKNYKRFNQKIRDISVAEEIHLIDLAKEVPGDSTAIYDFIHLNTSGSELVTDIITKQLVELYPNYTLNKNNLHGSN